MRKEIIETGKTVDAAIDSACEQLGCERDNCQWEIIDLPKKTLLGLKTIPAKVRVSIEVPDETVPSKPVQEMPRYQKPQNELKPLPEKKPEPRQVEEKSKRTEPKQKIEKRPQPEEESFASSREMVTEGFTEKEEVALDYIQGILRDFGLIARLELYREESGISVDIKGDGLGTIIGRRGETLDAIQYLSGLVANRLGGDYLRVTVDCGDYRTKRRDTLEALAKKLAAQALKTNTGKTLEPMNPFERRVIHATISKIEGVTSSSIGEEPNRRVVITTPTANRSRPGSRGRERDHDSDRRGGGPSPSFGGRGGRSDDRRRPSRGAPRPSTPSAPSGPPKETPESSVIGDVPIGKLDLE